MGIKAETREIPLLVPINIQSPEAFVEERLGFLKNNVKKHLIYPIRNYPIENDIKGEYKVDILETTNRLKELLPSPIPRTSKKLDYAILKYVSVTSKEEGSSHGFNEFNRKKFGDVFMNAYETFGFKYGGMFINKFIKNFDWDTVDNNFWNLVKEVKGMTDESTTYLYAKWYYYIKSWGIEKYNSHRWNEDSIPNIERNFQKNFLKTYRESGYKNTHAFCRGVLGLTVNTEITNFDNYTYLSIMAGKQVLNPNLAFWTIDTISLLEQEQNFDYAPSQFLEDTKKIIDSQGEKVAFSFVYGISGAVKESREHRRYLNMDLYKKKEFDKDPNWLEDALKKVEKSDDPLWAKEWDKEHLLNLKGYEKRLNKYYLPEKQAEVVLYDPELFRKNFIKLLTEMSPRESRLYAQIYNFGMLTYYNNGMESDIKFLVNSFPTMVNDLKNTVSKKVYDSTIGLTKKISRGAVWVLRNFWDGVKKCYIEHGEEETLKRIIWTMKLARNHFVNGLERPGRRKIRGGRGEKSKERMKEKKRREREGIV